jgi:type VI secretion system secreted protein Hcp
MKYAIILVIALGLITAGISNSFATTTPSNGDPIFMKIDGIDGDVTAQGHEKEIELNSFQFGAKLDVSPISSGGASAGKVSLSEIVGTKIMDKSSPLLFQKLVTGSHIPQVDIYFVKFTNGSPQTYAHYILQDVLISGYSVSSGGDIPTESLSLNFAKIQFEFTPTNTDGSPGSIIHAGWDLALVKAI